MSQNDKKSPPNVSPPMDPRRDRRSPGDRAPPRLDPKALGTIAHDDLGNAVWNWHVDVPRRRDDDPTIDLLECLDADELSLESDEGAESDEGSFNPYNKAR
jgi:hypothetical protein